MSKYEVVKFVNDEIKLDVNVSPSEETVWLTQEQMAKLFLVQRTNIAHHISNIYKSKELDEISTCEKYSHVRLEGNRKIKRTINLYNLDMIISVGYRVNSKNGIIFRKWASSVLKNYLLKGYSISNRAIISQENYLALTNKVIELDKDVNYIKKEIKLINPSTQIFYQGEYYKSYVFINKILKEAKRKLTIIDPYIDSNIFQYLKFIEKNIKCILICSAKAKIATSEIKTFKDGGHNVTIDINDSFHDRFIIIDDDDIYHIGTSFNYLGAKTFLISKVDDENWVKKFIKSLKNR